MEVFPLQGTLERKGAPRTIIIIGAGLAGLSAAYELTQAHSHRITQMSETERIAFALDQPKTIFRDIRKILKEF